MGSESSILQKCDLEAPYETSSSNNQWRIHPARNRVDGSRFSVFVHEKSVEAESDEAQNTAATVPLENAAKQLRLLRHPTILKFFASCNNVEGTYLITEQIKPLELVLDSLTCEELCAGLYNIVEALSFLHERGGATHNNLCISSLYVSQDGSWRLGNMEHLCKFEEATAQFLKNSHTTRNSDAIPPEEREADLKQLPPECGHARDAFAFGLVAQSLMDYYTELGEITNSFVKKIEEDFLDSDPHKRPKLKTLLDNKLFKNDFLDITNFLAHITVKPEPEKTRFFQTLVPRLLMLPAELVAARIVPKLLMRFVMADPVAAKHVFPHILTPYRDPSPLVKREFIEGQINPVLPVETYKKYFLPYLEKIFPTLEIHIRLILMDSFAAYVEFFDTDVLTNVIQPQLLLGLKDVNDEIVAASLHGLAELVRILGAATVVGGARGKYFAERRPKLLGESLLDSSATDAKPPPQQQQAGHLTAVSGIMALPQPPPPPSTPRGGQLARDFGELSSERLRQIDTGMSREQEKERRRLEAKKRNEEKKKERERRKAMQTHKGSLGAELVRGGGDTDFTQLKHFRTRKDSTSSLQSIEEREEEEGKDPDGSGGRAELDGDGATLPPEQEFESLSSSKEKEDWSDWDDVDSRGSHNGSPVLAKEVGVKARQTPPPDEWSRAEEVGNWNNWDNVVGGGGAVPPHYPEETGIDTLHAPRVAHPRGAHATTTNKYSTKKPTLLEMAQSHGAVAAKTPAPEPKRQQQQQKKKPAKKRSPMSLSQKKLGEEFAITVKPPAVVPSPEIDFFSDMMPTVAKASASTTPSSKPAAASFNSSPGKPTQNKFAFESTLDHQEDGWGEDGFGWDIDEN